MPDPISFQNLTVHTNKVGNIYRSFTLLPDRVALNFATPAVMQHPALWTLNQGDKKEPLPIVEQEEQALYSDRYDSNRYWYLPNFSIQDPLDKGVFFDAEFLRKGISNGKEADIYGGSIVVHYRKFQSEASKTAWQRKKQGNQRAQLKEIPIALSAFLTLEWEDGQQKKQEARFAGQVDAAAQRIVFHLEGNMLKNAYLILAKELGTAKVELPGHFYGWVASPEEEESNKPKGGGFITGGGKPVYMNYSGANAATPLNLPKTNTAQHFTATATVNPKLLQSVRKLVFDRHSAAFSHVQFYTAEEKNYAKQRFVTGNAFSLDFPCNTHHQVYTRTKDGATIAMGCLPPWDEQLYSGKLYNQIFPSGISEAPGKLYQSLAQPSTFLFIPDAYLITRLEDTGFAPVVAMTSALNPEVETENFVDFTFVITPDFSAYQQMELKKIIRNHLGAATTAPINIIYPTDLGQVPQLAIANLEGAAFSGLSDGDSFNIKIGTDELAQARLIEELLKGQTEGLVGEIRFDIDRQQKGFSAFKLNLNNTVGEVVQQEWNADKKELKLTNACESPVEVKGVAFYNEPDGQAVYHTLPAPLRIEPAQSATRKLNGAPAAFSGIALDVAILEDPELGLSERRIHVDLIEKTIGLTASISPSRYQLSHLTVDIRFPYGNIDTQSQLLPQNGSFVETSDFVNFILPLDKYLQPEYRVIRYRLKANYSDGSSQLGPWEELNFVTDGANINVNNRLMEKVAVA